MHRPPYKTFKKTSIKSDDDLSACLQEAYQIRQHNEDLHLDATVAYYALLEAVRKHYGNCHSVTHAVEKARPVRPPDFSENLEKLEENWQQRKRLNERELRAKTRRANNW
jgi:hypothetical protein